MRTPAHSLSLFFTLTLSDLINRTLQSGHSLLFPVDPSARLLELLVLLDQHWSYAYSSGGMDKRFPLCLVSRTGKEVVERARTFMEWMTREWATRGGAPGASMGPDEEQGKGQSGRGASKRDKDRAAKQQATASPLDFRHLRIFSSLAALDEAFPPSQPKLILAVPPSLSHGPSRTLLARFAQSPEDVVVLTQRGEAGSLARWLWERWEERQSPGARWGQGKVGAVVQPGDEFQIEVSSIALHTQAFL